MQAGSRLAILRPITGPIWFWTALPWQWRTTEPTNHYDPEKSRRMRALFIILVVLNLLVFASVWIFEAPASPSTSPRVNLPSAPEKLILLQELEQGARTAPRRDPVVRAVDSEEAGDMCTMVGPFGVLLHAEYFVDRLAAMDVDAVIRSLEVP